MLHNLRQKKEVRVFVWQTFNGFVTLLITLLGSVKLNENFVFALPFIYSAINAFTKRVNITYFKDLGVNEQKR